MVNDVIHLGPEISVCRHCYQRVPAIVEVFVDPVDHKRIVVNMLQHIRQQNKIESLVDTLGKLPCQTSYRASPYMLDVLDGFAVSFKRCNIAEAIEERNIRPAAASYVSYGKRPGGENVG